MAEINKLSIGQALDQLRKTNAAEGGPTRLDGEIDRLDEEMERLKATRRSVERNQRAGSTRLSSQEANTKRTRKPTVLWITIGTTMAVGVLALLYTFL